MSIFTQLARMWLTRSFKKFTFLPEYDNVLDYSDCDSLGLYVHIPFCRQLCNFCPYCKQVYDSAACNEYIDALISEIGLVGSAHEGRKRVTSLYFGGGTPALAARRIGEIIAALRRYFDITDGIGIELHPEDVTEETLLILKEAGVTRISIGVQSFNEKFGKLLGRKAPDAAALKKALSAVPFETVSMDFIFALPDQTFEDLREDADTAFESGANHIAIYPFIDFTFTPGKVHAMPGRQKRKLLDEITLYCEGKGYVRNSVWTFSSDALAAYSSMTRQTFLGFGCSAVTLLREQFKINTFSVNEYISRVKSGRLPTSLTLRFTRRQRMVYYLFWEAYSTHVDGEDFRKFFGVPLEKMYGTELKIAEKLELITARNGVYSMTLKGAYYYHYYENFYTLAYIDKMWGVMRREAFPKRLKL